MYCKTAITNIIDNIRLVNAFNLGYKIIMAKVGRQRGGNVYVFSPPFGKGLPAAGRGDGFSPASTKIHKKKKIVGEMDFIITLVKVTLNPP